MFAVFHKSSPASRRRRFQRICVQILLFISPVFFISACGKFFPDPDTLVAITVSPASQSIQLSGTQQFMAVGMFGDNTSRDVTSSVIWTSSSANIATINSSGLATGIATGVTTITASQSGHSGTAGLQVIIGNGGGGLTISCSGCTSQSSGSFTATLSSGAVNFSASNNGSTVVASWTSSNTNVATIGAGTGIAMLVATGTTTISATATGASGSVTLTVQ